MKRFTLLFVILLSLSIIQTNSMHVKGNKLYDSKGNEFIFRGINIAHNWFVDKTYQSIKEVANLGANSARFVLGCGALYPKTPYSEVKQIIDWCKNEGLVCILEVHDFTGSDEPTDITFTTVNYWKEMKDLVNAHKDFIIVNIANEWQGSWKQGNLWGDTYVTAVKQMRSIGIKNALIVDASGYAQESEPVIKDAKRVLNADPDRNVIFSYHVYSALGKDDATLYAGFDGLKNTGVCWIVGEFGWWQNYGDVVYKTLMNYCQKNGIGWLAWSWSGNSGIDTCLDIVSPNTFSSKDLTKWGKYVFYGEGGISTSSKKSDIGSNSNDYSSENSDSEYCNSCEVTGTGEDGSKWGWENGKSCRIDTNKCGFNSLAPNGYPYCSSCETTYFGDDGVRWGWENDQSCVINTSRC